MKHIQWKQAAMYLPAVVLMIIIFLFSSKPAQESSSESSRIVTLVLHAVEYLRRVKFSAQEFSYWAEKIHTPIRKLAHMTEYAVLSWTFLIPSVIQAKKTTGKNFIKEKTVFQKGIFHGNIYWLLCLKSIVLSMLYASTDEFHQLFVEGRSGSIKDVCIDTLGASLGVLFLSLIWQFKERNPKGTSARKESNLDE